MPRPKLTDIVPTGVFEERQLPDGRRKITLRKAERRQLKKQQLAEAAAALFLDLEHERTWADIANELGLSTSKLRDLTKSPEFDSAYNKLFAELGHDPRYKAAQGHISDMLPVAVRELKNLLSSPNTPAGVRLKAIERILLLNGLHEPQEQHSDRQELVKFLVEHRINVEAVGLPLPNDYQKALAEYAPEVVDAVEVHDVTPEEEE